MYTLIYEGDQVYIGCAVSPEKRLKQHRKKRPEGDGIDLEIYVGIRGEDFDEWIDRMPTAADMEEMMQTLLVFIICAASKQT